MAAYEIADVCKECQRRHFKIGKKQWNVKCKGIPKELWDDDYYPLEKILGKEDYDTLTLDEKVQYQYKYNKILWAKDKLGWSPFNPKRKFFQFYQKHMLLCTANRKAGRLGRRMGSV